MRDHLTLINVTQQTTWFPRRCDTLAVQRDESAATEGGTFREPAPARIPRHAPLFKSDEQMRSEGWEPVSEWGVAKFIGGCIAALLCLVLIANVGARWVA